MSSLHGPTNEAWQARRAMERAKPLKPHPNVLVFGRTGYALVNERTINAPRTRVVVSVPSPGNGLAFKHALVIAWERPDGAWHLDWPAGWPPPKGARKFAPGRTPPANPLTGAAFVEVLVFYQDAA